MTRSVPRVQVPEARLRANAQRGAELLDRVWPGWHRAVKISKLNMAEGPSCVLGQLSRTGQPGAPREWGFYTTGVLALSRRIARARRRGERRLPRGRFDRYTSGVEVRYGFLDDEGLLDRDTERAYYAVLDDEWRRQIRARRRR